MSFKDLFIIAGCNGAGKTTASFTLLPEIVECREFVNADEIAKGLSPFQPERAAWEAGRIMRNRINELLEGDESFAFETTLASRSHAGRIEKARLNGFNITLIFFWLQTVELAKERVKIRVAEGGHDIPPEVIERRYRNGICNLFDIYLSLVDGILILDNSASHPVLVARKERESELHVLDEREFDEILRVYDKN